MKRREEHKESLLVNEVHAREHPLDLKWHLAPIFPTEAHEAEGIPGELVLFLVQYCSAG